MIARLQSLRPQRDLVRLTEQIESAIAHSIDQNYLAGNKWLLLS